jgi:hypothetical protein
MVISDLAAKIRKKPVFIKNQRMLEISRQQPKNHA